MLELVIPALEDLWFREKLMADEETMSYNHAWGGTIPFPKEEWKEWYDRWIVNHDGRRFYRYLKDETGFVGEIAYHYDREYDGYVADVIVFSKYRGKGYGAQGLKLLCAAAKENGITVLYDDIAIDNSAINLFLKQGFCEEYRTEEKIVLKKELIDYSTYWDKCWAEEDAEELFGYLEGWNKYSGTEIDVFKQFNVHKVCDAACGFGAHTLLLASNGFEVSAFDISPRAVELTTEALNKYGYNNVDVKLAGLIDTGYEDDSFDAVTAYAVIDHLTEKDSKAALRELMRIIKSEGLLLLSFDKPDEEDFAADHEELPDGSMIYTDDSSRNGMIFRPYNSERIEALVQGYNIVKEWNNQKGDRFVIIQNLKREH